MGSSARTQGSRSVLAMDRNTEHKIVKSFAEQRAEGVASGATANGMVCPQCSCKVTMVCNTRRLFGQVRRYRQCVNPKCLHRFVTKERMDTPEK